MRILIFILLAIAITTTSCGPSKRSTSPTASVASNDSSALPTAAIDGSSYEKAIVITEKSSGKGIAAEYDWLKKNYPGYKLLSQSLSHHNKKSYDVLSIQTADGARKEIYFDITGFFGKW